MRRLILALAFLLAPFGAFAQSVQQSGSVTVGHVPYFVTNGVIGDGGTASDSPISSIGVTNNSGPGICVSTGRATAAGRQQLCLSATLNGAASITLQNYGSASPQAFNVIVNGTTYPFPGAFSTITIGTTAIGSGVSGQCLYVNGSVIGNQVCTGTTMIVGTTPVTSGAANGVLYNNAGTLGNLTPNGNGVLVTSNGGAPSISTTLPANLTIPSPTVTGTVAGTFTASGTVNFSGVVEVGGTAISFPASGLLVGTTDTQVLTNKTLTAPTINGGTAVALTDLAIRSSGLGAFDLTLANSEHITAGRTLTLTVNDASRVLNLSGDLTTGGAFTTSSTFSVTGAFTTGGAFTTANAFTTVGAYGLTITATNTTNSTLPAGTHTLGGLDVVQSWIAQQTFNIASTITSATAATLNDIYVPAATTTITGNTGTPITALSKVYVGQPTITDSSSVTVTDASTVYVDNAPTNAASATLTNAWAIRVGAGNVKFPGTGNVLGTIISGTWNGTIVGAAYGGTGNGFFAVSGPASSTKTFTFPNSSQIVAMLDLADQTLSGGANVTSSNQGTKSSGTFTVDCGVSPLQYIVNGGAFTLAAPANDGSCIVRSLNNGSAGTITFSGFTVGSNTGDVLTTVNTNAFAIQIWRINGVSRYLVSAYQ